MTCRKPSLFFSSATDQAISKVQKEARGAEEKAFVLSETNSLWIVFTLYCFRWHVVLVFCISISFCFSALDSFMQLSFFFQVSFLSRPIGYLSLTHHSPCSLALSYIFVYLHFSLFLGHWVGAVVYSKPCRKRYNLFRYMTIWSVRYGRAGWNAFSFLFLLQCLLIPFLFFFAFSVTTATTAVHFAFSTPNAQSSPLPSFRQQHSSPLPHPTFTTPQPSPNPCNGVPQRETTACPPAT